MSSASPFESTTRSPCWKRLGYSLHPNIIYGRFSRSIRLHLGNLSGSFQIIDNVMPVFFFYLTGLVKERWPERGVKDIINSLNSRLKEIRQQDALKE